MKLFIIMLLSILFSSCSIKSNADPYRHDRITVVELWSNAYNTVSIITIDSVEYIMCDNYKGGISITPKIKK
jgi:hypothetical protein